ncbi:MAG TPA: proline dehydrogenase family protein [Thermodesulfobacteriota bacterium]|nr:proline dehydrogenase family protein [Thermodesulfobacteriota bacterium]
MTERDSKIFSLTHKNQLATFFLAALIDKERLRVSPMNLANQFILSGIKLLPKALVKRFAMRYIAGEKLDDAVRVVSAINLKRMMGTMDVLGENISTREESLAAVRECEEVLHAINQNHLDANLSIKLTQFGLKIDKEFCHSNVKRLIKIAAGYNNFIRIDMEDSSTTGETLQLYGRLRSEGYENVGVVIQANMRRSEEDVRKLVSLKPNIRLCKGAYIEPEAIAFRGKDEIRLNYLKLLEMLFKGKCHVGIATHDDFLVGSAYQRIPEMNLQKSDYEFQMLYGVKSKLRDRIVADGHRLRVYVPFGRSWHAYSIRRFKENPQMVRYVLRALFFPEG